MNLKKYYQDKPTKELMSILENYSDYTEECVLVVKEIFELRNIDIKEINQLALEINKEKIQKVFQKMDLSQKEIIPHKSPFISESKMRKLYKTALNIFRNNKPDIDVWSYSIGGI